MMKFLPLAGALLLAGCFSAPPQPSVWAIGVASSASSSASVKEGSPASISSSTRIGAITVFAPWDSTRMPVLRADGSVAFDAYNVFASTPSQLLRGPFMARIAGDGRFGAVINSTSIANAETVVELTVTELVLDCREEGMRQARVSIRLQFISSGRASARNVMKTLNGAGLADASGGDYGKAFTEAFDAAVDSALSAAGAQ